MRPHWSSGFSLWATDCAQPPPPTAPPSRGAGSLACGPDLSLSWPLAGTCCLHRRSQGGHPSAGQVSGRGRGSPRCPVPSLGHPARRGQRLINHTRTYLCLSQRRRVTGESHRVRFLRFRVCDRAGGWDPLTLAGPPGPGSQGCPRPPSRHRSASDSHLLGPASGTSFLGERERTCHPGRSPRHHAPRPTLIPTRQTLLAEGKSIWGHGKTAAFAGPSSSPQGTPLTRWPGP